MVRTVRTFLPVTGDPAALSAAFEGDPGRWLTAARRIGPDGYALTLRALGLSRAVQVEVGDAWRAGVTRWRTVSWEPIGSDGAGGAGERMLPSLDGELGLHVEGAGRTTLVLDARYDPPGGAVGAALDAVALSRVAEATVQRFTADVAAGLSAEATLMDSVS